jgi:hypothetical protein
VSVRRAAMAVIVGLAVCSCGDGSAAPASVELTFLVQPSTTISDQIITPPVEVGLVDGSGRLLTTRTDAITLRLVGPTTIPNLSGTLTVNAAAGVATFSDLRVGVPGNSYILQAGAGGLVEVPSLPFDVTPHPGTAPPQR